MKAKYMAYVGSYSYTGSAKGITVYDVDVERGVFNYRNEVELDNSSYLTASSDGTVLYSIIDEGVAAYKIEADGNLTFMNSAGIRGMRGTQLAVDANDKYLFVAGYHDGKVTVMSLNPDGSIGNILAGVFHKGLGSVADRMFRPHVSCVRMAPDNKFILAADVGLDQIKIYRLNDKQNELMLAGIVTCDIDSAPRHFIFSSDGKYMYLMYEVKNVIDVYTYETGDHVPTIEKIQTISTLGEHPLGQRTAACKIRFSPDEKHLFCSNAGDNVVTIYERDVKTGLLNSICCLPISGDYPKDIAIFPDDKHLASINNEAGSITFFKIDYEKGLIIGNALPIYVDEPNCCQIVRLKSGEGKK